MPTRSSSKSSSVRARNRDTYIMPYRQSIRRARRSEAEILKHYQVGTLEELTRETADRLLMRLMEIGRQTPRTAG
jgi:hypothetical protein